MRITKSQLRKVIQEELAGVIREQRIMERPAGTSSEEESRVLDVSGEFDRPVYIQGDPVMTPEEIAALEAEQEYVYKYGVPADAKPGQYTIYGPPTSMMTTEPDWLTGQGTPENRFYPADWLTGRPAKP